MKRRRYRFKLRYQAYVYEEFDVAADDEYEAENAAYDRLEHLTRIDENAVEDSGEIMESSYEKSYAFMDMEE